MAFDAITQGNNLNLTPIGRKIKIALKAVNTTSKGGIILSEKRQTRDQMGEVLETGSKVSWCKIGDTVVFENGKFKIVGINSEGKEIAIIDEKDLVMVIDE